jgi:hypothetical protein
MEDLSAGQEYFGVIVSNPFRQVREGAANQEISPKLLKVRYFTCKSLFLKDLAKTVR